LLGGQVGDMVLWPLGGYVICGPSGTVEGDFKVAIAGPLTHLPQMAFWVLIFWIAEGDDFGELTRYLDLDETSFMGALAAQSFFLNLVLMIFNLFIPAYPLDGGRCLAAGLIMCGMNVVTAAMTTAVVGMIIAALMACWGIVEFFMGSPTGVFTAAIGFWIGWTSYELFKLTRPASGMYGEPIDNLKTHPVFGQECYQNRGHSQAAAAAGNNNNV
jgi:Zn-dependent protease